jgi:hypothetical protein
MSQSGHVTGQIPMIHIYLDSIIACDSMTNVGRPNYFEQHLMDEKVFNNSINKPKISFLLHMLHAYFFNDSYMMHVFKGS